MLETIFAFVETILGGAGVDPEAAGIVSEVFALILGLFGM